MPSRAPAESIPGDAFLHGVPAPPRKLAERLRGIVREAARVAMIPRSVLG